MPSANSAHGLAALSEHVDHALQRRRHVDIRQSHRHADEDAEQDGIGHELACEARQLRRPPLGENAPDGDHDRHMDGDQQEQGHGPLVAIGFQDQGDANEYRIGLRGAEARDDAGDRVDPEIPPGDHVPSAQTIATEMK